MKPTGARMRGWLAAIVAGGLLAACGSEKDPGLEASAKPGGTPLTVEQQLAPDYRIVSGVFTNRDIGDARARIGGRLSRVAVREGDTVKAGQVVAVISDERIALEARAGEAAVVAAQSAAEQARKDLDRAERLFASGAVSTAAIEQARSQARSADAGLKAARAQAGAAVALNDQGQVTAPAAGKVTRIPSPQGSVVMPGEVVVAISTGAPVLRIELPESEAERIVQGESVRFFTEGDPDTLRDATVRQVYPAVTRGRVMADLDAPGIEDSLVGARVKVMAPAGEREAIIIPASYVLTRYGADYARLVRPGGAVVEAPIQKGSRAPTEAMPDGVEILSGLRPGDQILPAEPQP